MAVDRLYAKGWVTRVESTEDRRVRIIALTPRGKDLIVSAFIQHSGLGSSSGRQYGIPPLDRMFTTH